MSIGSLTTSCMFETTYEIHSFTKHCICKKSEDISMDITFLRSKTGSGDFASFKFYSFSFCLSSELLFLYCTCFAANEISMSVSFVPPPFWFCCRRSFWWRYLISHSKILMSQWTDISISSKTEELVKYFSKYFMYFINKSLSHLKALSIFRFSS